jgi:hypothetical protein
VEAKRFRGRPGEILQPVPFEPDLDDSSQITSR